MNTEQALRVVLRRMPCSHETLDTRFGDGSTWARCEDCGATIERAMLPVIRKRAREFEEAFDVLRAACAANIQASRPVGAGDGNTYVVD